MYKISELAAKVGLSRTTLLYYEKLNLIQGRRLSNGYRVYTDIDIQRIQLIRQLQQGGLTLKECKICLAGKLDKTILKQRLAVLDSNIAQMQQSRQLLSAMLGDENEKHWHESAIQQAPDVYLDWLNKQGLNEKEALRLKWLSKNMTQHEQYMQDFMHIFQPLKRWGPGSEQETLKALAFVSGAPQQVLEIGCGKGLATVILAQQLTANITTLDNESSVVVSVNDMLKRKGYSDKAKAICASMTQLPFDKASFDLIWSEAAAYIMGVEKALASWKALLKPNGYLVFSDLVMHSSKPTETVKNYWQKEYPDMQTVATRRKQIAAAGYQLIADFSFANASWDNYYLPLKARIDAVKADMPHSQALQDIEKEVNFYLNHGDDYGYQMFVLKKV